MGFGVLIRPGVRWRLAMRNGLKRCYANVMKVSCPPKGKDPLGEVEEGCFIKLSAPVVEMEISRFSNMPGIRSASVTPVGVEYGWR